jgi:glutaredoxin
MSITVFTRSTCGPCKTLKYWLGKKGVSFTEIDADANPDAHAEATRDLGYSIVPFTLVDTGSEVHKIAGMNLTHLASLL